jgi:hypothetical protein
MENTMSDPTESIRRTMIETGQPYDDLSRAMLYGKLWSIDELRQEFDVLGFLAPFVVVRRKSDGANGTCEFIHSPRVYFNFVEE